MPSSSPDQTRPSSLVVILLGLLPLRLIRSLLFNHRLFVGLICLCLFPVFLFTTLVSSFLGLVINHIAYHHHSRPSSPSSRRAASIPSSPTSSSPHMDDRSTSRSYGQNDMDYWLQRCSICFEAQLDLCLDFCRDQYCLECFSRYVTEVVTSSWGLSVTKIRCPVCQDPIPQSEWSKFVPKSVVEHYNRFNQPYRRYSRCCPHCDTEVSPCDYHNRGYVVSPEGRKRDRKGWVGGFMFNYAHKHTALTLFSF
ncbi:hypothetical protein BX666DRAFT_1966224 [Dichotomocladium elegans]|nr:hypothetical protein BX666DRAFT_1966224 [Dichotomocladium elegans]